MQNSESLRKYNKAMEIFADGNTLRVVCEPEEIKKPGQKKPQQSLRLHERPKRPERNEVNRNIRPARVKPSETRRKAPAGYGNKTAARSKAAAQNKAAVSPAKTRQVRKAVSISPARLTRIITIAASVAIVTVMLVIYLSTISSNNILIDNVSKLESEYAGLKAQNDAAEFEINSTIDINEVIRSATEDLGMVRGSADQIITYDTSGSEYIQLFAGIPNK